jgi:hypothetical protein
MAKVTYTIGVQVTGGPQITVPRTREVEAIDKLDIVLPPKTDDLTVDLQPGAATKIALLLIKSDLYGKEITFTLKGGAEESEPLTLEEPHLFINDAVTLFGVTTPTSITFKSAFADDATKKANIEVLVARRAGA